MIAFLAISNFVLMMAGLLLVAIATPQCPALALGVSFLFISQCAHDMLHLFTKHDH